MLGRREFLSLLGLTTTAGLTVDMLEALGAPNEIMDLTPRPLIVSVGHSGLDDINQIVIKNIMPGIADAFYRSDPILLYFQKGHS